MTDIVSLSTRVTSSTPLSSPTASSHADPATRGTWASILTICVWNALHLDIPLRPRRWELVAKLPSLAIGLLAPDYLLYLACCQLYPAKHLSASEARYLTSPESGGSALWTSIYTRFVCSPAPARPLWRHQEEKQVHVVGTVESAGVEQGIPDALPPNEETEATPVLGADSRSKTRKHAWTLVHSFYAAMGGFVLDIDASLVPAPAPTPQYQPGQTRFALTSHRVLFVVQLLYFCAPRAIAPAEPPRGRDGGARRLVAEAVRRRTAARRHGCARRRGRGAPARRDPVDETFRHADLLQASSAGESASLEALPATSDATGRRAPLLRCHPQRTVEGARNASGKAHLPWPPGRRPNNSRNRRTPAGPPRVAATRHAVHTPQPMRWARAARFRARMGNPRPRPPTDAPPYRTLVPGAIAAA
ncbi:uncharacterized protein PHACADRAFT_209694 [Phanerochaete carnosa HHB-10118-sp]|uniref:Uncharacterized protein n=1 Tax=Phanerochaete carnosa (strain HHB-10118-sp) TaxID=650164 RepID=K5WB53_PHACS|nr:uncharacterized protein PHACADRAFT_209694 [Phanerochaete carnosa HHB-10118-sp]EKM56219.1 hypothetical protein PHACADRAFT_209694 [Phanerochaete carnosa HHB-10118-sp]